MYTYELTMASGKVLVKEATYCIDKLERLLDTYTFIYLDPKSKEKICRSSSVESIEQFLTSEYQPASTKLDL